jgi:hydroxymethylbilane synthase
MASCLPDAGQGAIGIEVRSDDPEALEAAAGLNDPATLAAVTSERALLRALGGGCQVPIGAWGRIEEGRLKLDAAVASPDGSRILRDSDEDRPGLSEDLGRRLAGRLLDSGAAELLKGI